MNQSALSKVLLVSGVYPPQIGGPSLQTEQIAQGLLNRGIQTQVVTYGDPEASGVINGVPVLFLDSSPQPHFLGKLWRNVRVYRDLHRVMGEFQPNVVHLQTAAGTIALLTGIAARWHRIPSLIKYTADLVHQKMTLSQQMPAKGHRALIQYLDQHSTNCFQTLLFLIYDCIWATTPLLQQRVIQDYEISAQKVVLLPNFLNLQPLVAIAEQRAAERQKTAAQSAPIVLLTVARLFPVKGLDIYIQALAQLRDLPLQVRIVGNGSAEYETYLKQLAVDLDVADRIEFVGAVSPDNIAAEYLTADIFVLPSRHEAFGIALIEAMAAGVPIVASRVDGIPMVVEEGVSAQLVPPEDATSLATAIRTLVSYPQLRQDFAAAGRARAKRFDFEHTLNTLIDIYQTCILPNPYLPAEFGPVTSSAASSTEL